MQNSSFAIMREKDRELFFGRSVYSRHMLRMAMRKSANIMNKWKSRVALPILFIIALVGGARIAWDINQAS